MENVKKEKSVVNNQSVVEEYKKSYELTEAEINALPKVLCQIEKIVTKKGNVFFTLTARFDGAKGKYKKSKNIDEQLYNHFVRKHNLNPNLGKYVISLPVRFVEGLSKQGNPYKSYQIYLSDKIAINDLLKYFDLTELADFEYHMDFIKCTDQIEVDDVEEF